jgi:ABC-type sugar transport system permease subunit
MRRVGPLVLPFTALWGFFWLAPFWIGLDIALSTPGASGFKDLSFAQFERVLNDPKFLHSLENTTVYVLGTVLITLGVSFFLALSVCGMGRMVRSVCLFLLLIPGFALPGSLATLFYLFFHGKSGALNQFIVIPLGFEPVNWMMDPAWILPCLVMQAVWRWTGLVTLVLYCGICAIPKWQFEVAQIEGVSAWYRVRTIFFPGIRHLLLFAGVFLAVDGVAAFSGAYNLLGGSGGVLDSGLLFVTYAYQVAFPGGSGRFDLPMASAGCVLVASATAFGAWFILWVQRQRDNRI